MSSPVKDERETAATPRLRDGRKMAAAEGKSKEVYYFPGDYVLLLFG